MKCGYEWVLKKKLLCHHFKIRKIYKADSSHNLSGDTMKLSRRSFLKILGIGLASKAIGGPYGCGADSCNRLEAGQFGEIASGLHRSGGLSLDSKVDETIEYIDGSSEQPDLTVSTGMINPGFRNMFIPRYPIFNNDGTFYKKPQILRVRPNGNVSVFYEFSEETAEDFRTGFAAVLEDMEGNKEEALGLLFNVRVVERGRLVVAVNSSNKLWEISPDGLSKVIFEGSESLGITDLLSDKDSELYCARCPLLDSNDQVIRKGGIAKIAEGGSIVDAVELPDDSQIGSGFITQRYDVYHFPIYLTMNMVGHSKQNNDPSNIFITHNFDERIYLLNPKNMSLDIFNEKLIQPTGLTQYRNWLYTMESPLLDEENNCVKPPQITEIDIEEGTTSPFQELDPSDDYATGFTADRESYRLPRGLRLQLKLDNNQNFFIEDSLRNNIQVLTTQPVKE